MCCGAVVIIYTNISNTSHWHDIRSHVSIASAHSNHNSHHHNNISIISSKCVCVCSCSIDNFDVVFLLAVGFATKLILNVMIFDRNERQACILFYFTFFGSRLRSQRVWAHFNTIISTQNALTLDFGSIFRVYQFTRAHIHTHTDSLSIRCLHWLFILTLPPGTHNIIICVA